MRISAGLSAVVTIVASLAGAARGQCESQLAKLVGAPGSAGANTGASVSIDGDTMAVGSPYSDINGTDAGAVFVYRRVNGAWTQEAVLTYPSGGAVRWYLGDTVALSGNTIVATAPGYASQSRLGIALEYRRTDGVWTLRGSPAANINTAFRPIPISLSGDALMVGWQAPASGGKLSTIYTRDPGSDSFVLRGSVLGSEAVGTDGEWFFASSGVQDGNGSSPSPAVFGLRRPSGDVNWGLATTVQIDAPYIAPGGPTGYGLFGLSLAIRGRTLLVGAPGYDSSTGEQNVGEVQVFERIGQSVAWLPTVRLSDPDNNDQDFFGWSVAFDTQNPDRFAVGSVWANVGGAADAGAAFVYERDGLSEWRQIRREVALDADEGDQLGMCVAMSGGLLAAGAPTDDQQAGNGGAAYVFSVDPQRPVVSGGPNGSTVRVGQNASLSVTAAGGGPITYQWRRDGQNLADGGRIAGSRTPTLRLRNCRWADVGVYDCIVSNGCGATTSDAAALTVLCPADFNDDAFLDFFDYDDFIHAFETGAVGADFNADGFVDFFDYDDFVAAFEAGC